MIRPGDSLPYDFTVVSAVRKHNQDGGNFRAERVKGGKRSDIFAHSEAELLGAINSWAATNAARKDGGDLA